MSGRTANEVLTPAAGAGWTALVETQQAWLRATMVFSGEMSEMVGDAVSRSAEDLGKVLVCATPEEAWRTHVANVSHGTVKSRIDAERLLRLASTIARDSCAPLARPWTRAANHRIKAAE